MKGWVKGALGLVLVGGAFWAYLRVIPFYRVEVRSELVMLGDLDGDHRWGEGDLNLLGEFMKDPFGHSDAYWCRLDLNQNGFMDAEDLEILGILARSEDPYAAARAAKERGRVFPRPRELYRYVPKGAFQPPPLWALPLPPRPTELAWLGELTSPQGRSTYQDVRGAELHHEAARFLSAYMKRQAKLNPVEVAYSRGKLARCRELQGQGDHQALLLELIGLVEDAETLAAPPAEGRLLSLLTFRDHLRDLLASDLFQRFCRGAAPISEIQHAVEVHLKEDLGCSYQLATLGPPRNLTDLENYLLRAEWQYYKSSSRDEDFRRLLDYAQHDHRYLRAVSRTSPRHRDPAVLNHNLPMVLLFREALRIKEGDKKRAVGLLDEAIRIPFGWIKSIPPERLPRSLALENFLLPGNKEDGSDKSRHWNVFGGICLYKSQEEALDLALKREVKDLREVGWTPEGMTEFLRDMIANLNGMYHVMAMDPALLQRDSSPGRQP